MLLEIKEYIYYPEGICVISNVVSSSAPFRGLCADGTRAFSLLLVSSCSLFSTFKSVINPWGDPSLNPRLAQFLCCIMGKETCGKVSEIQPFLAASEEPQEVF